MNKMFILLLLLGSLCSSAALCQAVGIVPFFDDLPREVLHCPSTVFMNLYWVDLQPEETSTLSGNTVRNVIERKLGRPLGIGPKVAIRFIAAGDRNSQHPLPDWFKKKNGWRAPLKCEVEDGLELPAWTRPDQLTAHAKVVKALAEGLDGNENIAWVEPGSYGFWGEGHLDGAPEDCKASEEIRKVLALPWIQNFKKTPMSITMDWFRPKDDPNHQMLSVWSRAASIGLRFDCLGFWHDEYSTVVDTILQQSSNKWSGPWGGEFCFGEDGALWSVGAKSEAPKDLEKGSLPSIEKLTDESRRKRIINVLSQCGWGYIAGAGGSLLDKKSLGAPFTLEMETSMKGTGRDLKKCRIATLD